MPDSFNASVSLWIDDLKSGKPDAAQKLWERYFTKLTRVASRKLGNAPRRISDEEDVAVDVFHSLCVGAQEGRFHQLENRDDLWKLLVAISGMKAVDLIRKQTAQKRGGGNVRGNSIVANTERSGFGVGFDQFLDSDPTPEFLAVMDEQQAGLFGLLRDESQRSVARLRFEGYSNQEIADQMGIAVRSVERKLKIIRDTWASAMEDAKTE